MSGATTEANVIGRNGLVIPPIEFDPRYDAASNVGMFLGRLWHANDEGPSEHVLRERLAYSHELVVPPAADKPLVVVRRSYTPSTELQRAADRDGNVRANAGVDDGGWGNHNRDVVTLGTTEQTILLAPTDGTLKWKELLSHRQPLRGGGVVTSREARGPELRYDQSLIAGDDLTPKPAPSRDEFPSWEERRERENERLRSLLGKFVELVS